MGLAQLAAWTAQSLCRHGLPKAGATVVSALIMVAFWCAISFNVWAGGTLTHLRRHVHDNLLAARFVAHMPEICGVGLYGSPGLDWVKYGGYTYLHRSVLMYWPDDEAALAAAALGFDTLLYTVAPPPDLGFETIRCFGQVCVARRPGRCEARPMAAMPFPEQLRALAPASDVFPAIPVRMQRGAPPPTAH
jgi:hypothetical protein